MRRVALLLALVAAWPAGASAQLSSHCDATCGILLGLSATTTATGALVAWGRASGGLEAETEGAVIWGTTFVATVGAGLLLGSDGQRQERAMNAAGLGIVVGSAAGYLVGALTTDDSAERWASLVIGAGTGALLGGILGAASYEEDFPRPSTSATLFSIRFAP